MKITIETDEIARIANAIAFISKETYDIRKLEAINTILDILIEKIKK